MAGRNEINEFAKKYDQNKAVVVKWEVAFMKEQGRKPTKVGSVQYRVTIN